MMKETQEATDYPTIALENMQEMELKRGLVSAELDACEAEIRETFGPGPGFNRAGVRGTLALEAVLGDEEASSELEAFDARRAYLERRAALCRDALAHVEERLEDLRRTWLTGRQAAKLPLEEVPEVLRERIRRSREERASREGA
jgi:hypothetical protein